MEIAITHSSTACVLLEIGSVRILTDPVLDGGSKTYKLGPAAWATRYIGPAVKAASLPPLDAVLLSHFHHLDNLDDAGRDVARRAPLVITGPHDKYDLDFSAVGLNPWEVTTIKGSGGEEIRVTATPALHGPSWLPETHRVVGFVLEWAGQEHGALYISGDTVFFKGIRQIADRFRIGTALLHLGAVHFWPPIPPCIRLTFNGREAARTAQLIGAKTVIPIHYERSVWSHFHESVESYNDEFEKAGLAKNVKWLKHGIQTKITV
jgi:L-ascorbate metabolism protein UlaG (beta-lactamase superfamily)